MIVDETFDVIVVGAGSAGCVLAARLSENPGLRVALIEAGEESLPAEVAIPAHGGLLPYGDRAWPSTTVPQAAAAGRTVPLVTGIGLGGSSSINSLGWLQAHPDDYDAWAAAGAEGWTAAAFASLFRRIEDHELGASATHGAGGPIAVSGPRHLHPLALAFVRAGIEQGWPLSEDLNGDRRTGISLVPSNVRDGRRHSVVDGYLGTARERPNLAVRATARVSRLLLDGARATGVRVLGRDGATADLLARRGVIVTAGALRTPQLLMLSGLGPGDHLAEHGIAVVRHLPAVGAHLQDHPAVALPFRLTTALPAYPDAEGDYRLARRGPLSTLGQVVGLVPAEENGNGPDLIYGLALLGQHAGLPALDGPDGAWITGLVDPESRGQVRLASADPMDDVVVDPRYLAEHDDRRRLREGVRKGYRTLGAPALRDTVDPLIPEPDGDDAMDALIDASLGTYYHPVGTARIGTDPGLSAVDPRLRVHGVDGLWVADASVMPRIPRTLPQATVVAVAERAADLIATDLA